MLLRGCDDSQCYYCRCLAVCVFHVCVRNWNQQCLFSCGSVTAQQRQTPKSHKWTGAQNWDETESRRSFPSGARSFHSRFDWGCLWAQTSSVIVCLRPGSQCLKTVVLKIDLPSRFALLACGLHQWVSILTGISWSVFESGDRRMKQVHPFVLCLSLFCFNVVFSAFHWQNHTLYLGDVTCVPHSPFRYIMWTGRIISGYLPGLKNQKKKSVCSN